MNLEFKWNDLTARCRLKKVNLFYGGNFTGKSALAKLFEVGFNGQQQGFEIDHQPVKKKEFEVILCDGGSSMSDELKLTSKTILSKEVKKIISELDNENNMIEQLNQAILELDEKMSKRWHELGIDNPKLFSGKFMFNDLNKMIKNQYLFYNEAGLSNTEAKIEYYQLCFRYLSELDNGILIIDEFDNCLDLFHCISLLDLFEQGNVTVMIFVKSAELCTYCTPRYPIFLMCRGLKEYSDYYENIVTKYTVEDNRRNSIIYTQEDEISFNSIKYKLYNLIFLQYISQFQMNDENFKKMIFPMNDLIREFEKN